MNLPSQRKIVGDIPFKPTEQQLIDVRQAHDNAGHPSHADFARLLRRGNANTKLAIWVRKNFSCPESAANIRPKARRPAAVAPSFRLKHVVGVDLVLIPTESI